ncbi:FliA/WhiG family RNA polymerase sigma factor [Desulfobaculum bizertense]|uniref:RNA polymerase, sigma 28 subunit, SigD/FliA/WhiG n=1 Tax=Desulfobaculum bizertense DSM 18034 TaxID=1121442 RepID=A0A1T4W705_9BACT|nr:FliA/WhiG family RNA polymerase sigma factor [Desulfobaculum bizertense]UIJ39098.1 FliA/WhiG family RNA polymerase sigma factor [Desulfobaculum bizertense]SKA73053.1 RNA polymerase, sigma 28 subunit, SigD/FliA/WhiG [Desulfobaculum bizertense DSM 18034]
METLNSSGKSSCSKAEPWKQLESGEVRWNDFSPYHQELIVRHFAPKIKILALRMKGKLPQQVELNELLSAGTLGLIECLGKFNPELKIKFSTYAENRIKGAMLDELRKMDWFSRGLRQRVRLLEDASRKIERTTGQRASNKELQEATGLSEKDVDTALTAQQNQLCLSIDAVDDHFSPSPETQNQDEPFLNVAFKDIIGKIAHLIDQLTDREKLVLSLYYKEELNMRETAEVMGITEGRVSQLHSQSLHKLKSMYRKQYGQD